MKRLLRALTSWLVRKPRTRMETCPRDAVPAPSAPEPVMTREAAEEIVEGLIRLGYLDYVPDEEKDEVREQLVKSVHLGYFETDELECETVRGQAFFVDLDRRRYRVDAEALGDGCVASYLEYMQAVLLHENVRLENLEGRRVKTGIDDETWKGSRYEVSVNGKTYIVFDTSNARPDLDTWNLGHRRLAEILNDLLATANSRTRAYGVTSGGEAWVMLLTTEQYDYMCQYPDLFQEGCFPVPPKEMPLNHRDYWPNGQPSPIMPESDDD